MRQRTLQSDCSHRKTRPFGILESSCGRCGLVESPQPPERNTPQFQTRTLHNPSDGKTDRQWVLHLSSRHISERNGCTQVHQQVSKGSQIRRPLVTVVTVSPRRKALCHLFMSRWFRVRFERRLAAASGLTLTEVVRMFMTHGGRVHARCAVPLVYVSMVSSAVRATARGCERSHLDRSRKQRRRSGPRRVMRTALSPFAWGASCQRGSCRGRAVRP